MDHISEAKEGHVLVKDDRTDLPSSWQNPGLACLKENSSAAALALFEEAHKKFGEKTDVNLLLQCHAAAKGDKKYGVFLAIARQLCQLRPEQSLHWFVLGSSLYKAVVVGLRVGQDKGLRVQLVRRWMKQLKRCVVIFKYCRKGVDLKLAKSIDGNIDHIRNYLLVKFGTDFLPQAERLDRMPPFRNRASVISVSPNPENCPPNWNHAIELDRRRMSVILR
jgi:hypothetical protein